MHEDKKPFACELCDSRFTRRHDMVRHVKTRHKDQQEASDGMEGASASASAPSAISLQAQLLEEHGEVEDTLEVRK